MKFLKRLPFWQVIAVPVLLIFAGAFSNQMVLVSNDACFPVQVNSAEIAKMLEKDPTPPDDFNEFSILNATVKHVVKVPDAAPSQDRVMLDTTHSVMRHSDHLKFLADWINLKDGVYSPGDELIILGEYLWAFAPLSWLVLVIKKFYDLAA